jgi:hypothetical protein
MRMPFPVVLLSLALAAPSPAQKRAAAKADPTFAEAVELAKKAADASEFGSAISALQAAIRDLQKKQRVAILAALPKPAGWEIEDEAPAAGNELVEASVAMVGMSVQRHYSKGDQRLDVEIMANSPFMQMLTMLVGNPALIKADGGEIVEYGAHKAILKKLGDDSSELQILMHDKHVIKVTSHGLSADDMFKIFDQAFVDGMEKPLGK